MKQWFFRFWDLHGDRTIFLTGATLMSLLLIAVGVSFEGFEDLVSAGKTTLVMILGILVNKARSPEAKFDEKEVDAQVNG